MLLRSIKRRTITVAVLSIYHTNITIGEILEKTGKSVMGTIQII